MSANIHGLMIYSQEKPMWHNITQPSLVPMSAEQIMQERFRGGFPIYLRPMTTVLNGSETETGYFSIVRGNSPYDEQEVIFGVCTERYHPLQPIEVAHSFDVNVLEPAETMAFLGDGEEMFISWVMPKISVAGREELEMYGIVRTGFDTLKGARLFTSIYRPVCANTVNMAEGWAKKNGSAVFRGKSVNKDLITHLGYWMSHVQENAIREANLLQSFFGKLAETPIKNDVEAEQILAEAYPIKKDVSASFPRQLRDANSKKTEAENNSQLELQAGILELFSGAGTEITPDYYGLFNATTEFFCHVQASKRPISESVMFGARQQNTMRVVDVMAKRTGYKS